jgi:drug/metabolite transporter (DMT)-like permease
LIPCPPSLHSGASGQAGIESMKITTARKAFFAIIIANLIWGAAAPIFKISLMNIPPYTLAFWRFFLGALVLLVILRKKATLPTKTPKDLNLLIAYAITGITINIIFFFWGLKLTYSINSPVISASAPVMTYLLALVFLKEKFYWKKLSGMILGTIGIIIIVIEPLLLHHDGNLVGNLFLVIATIAAVIQTIVGKDVLTRVNPIAFTFWAFIVGAASFLPLAIYEFGTIPHLYQSLDIAGYLGIAYGAVFSSAAGYALYAWGLSKIAASDASVFSYVDPVIGTVLGVLLLGEPITRYFVLGSVLIFGGIFLAEGRLHYHRFRDLHFVQSVEDTIKQVEKDIKISKTKNPSRSKHAILTSIFTKPS